MLRLLHLNVIPHQKKPVLFGEMTNARPGKIKLQNESEASYYTKKQKSNQRHLRLYRKDSGTNLKRLILARHRHLSHSEGW